MTFEMLSRVTIHTDYHTPVWLESGYDSRDGGGVARLTRADGSIVPLTHQQALSAQHAIAEIQKAANRQIYAAVMQIVDGSDVGDEPASWPDPAGRLPDGAELFVFRNESAPDTESAKSGD